MRTLWLKSQPTSKASGVYYVLTYIKGIKLLIEAKNMKRLSKNIVKSALGITLILGVTLIVTAGLPDPGMAVTHGNTALVITDPQNDFLSPKGQPFQGDISSLEELGS
jgi:hypothetical protein